MHPVQWGCGDSLEQLLGANSTLYYRVLDLPLQEWQKTQTVKVPPFPISSQDFVAEDVCSYYAGSMLTSSSPLHP